MTYTPAKLAAAWEWLRGEAKWWGEGSDNRNLATIILAEHEALKARLAEAEHDMGAIVQTACDADEADPRELLSEISTIALKYAFGSATKRTEGET